jgi:hypothetical protein
MDKEPMNNWVLEIEKLQARVDKLEAKVSGSATTTATATKPVPLPVGAKRDH